MPALPAPILGTPDATTSARRPGRSDGGFTLVELMVVVLIIGILLGIAIPTFLGARTRSQDAVAKSSLRTALTTAEVIYSDQQSFATADAPTLTSNEGSLAFVNSPALSTAAKTVSASAGAAWGGSALSDSGTCFLIKANGTGAVTYGTATAAQCNGNRAITNAALTKW